MLDWISKWWFEALFGAMLTGLGICLKFIWNRFNLDRQENKRETDAIKRGVQALLRAQMISEFNKAKEKGYAPIYAKDNFENIWQNYHALGLNGVMDNIHEKYMALPNREEDKIVNIHETEE